MISITENHLSPGNGDLDQVPLGGSTLDPAGLGHVTVHLTTVLAVHWIVYSFAA